MSTRSRSPGFSSNGTMVPPLWMNSSPVPSIFWRMKPSPPKNPAPSRLVNATLKSMSPVGAEKRVALAQQRLAAQRQWMILPGYGPANATFAPAAVAAEVGDEQALAGEELPLQAAEQAAVHLARPSRSRRS